MMKVSQRSLHPAWELCRPQFVNTWLRRSRFCTIYSSGVEAQVKLMGHFSSVFSGLAKSFTRKKGRSSDRCSRREAAEAMAKEAKRNHSILQSSDNVNIDGSNNFASVFSKRGKKGVNQDCCIVWEEFGCQEDMIFCGIFDGHGPWGHCVSRRETLSRTSLDPEIDIETEKKQQWFNIWKHSYLKTCATIDQELEQNRKIDTFFSGTTALSIVRQVIFSRIWFFALLLDGLRTRELKYEEEY